jgi:hypothetical protein
MNSSSKFHPELIENKCISTASRNLAPNDYWSKINILFENRFQTHDFLRLPMARKPKQATSQPDGVWIDTWEQSAVAILGIVSLASDISRRLDARTSAPEKVVVRISPSDINCRKGSM